MLKNALFLEKVEKIAAALGGPPPNLRRLEALSPDPQVVIIPTQFICFLSIAQIF